MENLYANVPRDLTRVKSKVFLNLTRRQLICFGAAAAIGVPLFFLIKKSGNVTLASLAMIAVMMPFFFLALYERNGTYTEGGRQNCFRIERKEGHRESREGCRKESRRR